MRGSRGTRCRVRTTWGIFYAVKEILHLGGSVGKRFGVLLHAGTYEPMDFLLVELGELFNDGVGLGIADHCVFHICIGEAWVEVARLAISLAIYVGYPHCHIPLVMRAARLYAL